MKNFLIAGGHGFVGSYLCARLLNRSMQVTSVDSSLFQASEKFSEIAGFPHLVDIELDAGDFDSLILNLREVPPISAIVNCAGPARPTYYLSHPVETATTLVRVTSSLLKLAHQIGVPYIHASSSEIYGENLHGRLSEDDLGVLSSLSLRAAYSEAKRLCETLVYSYYKQHRLSATILRLFNVYGPDFASDDDRVVPNLIRAINSKTPFPMHGDGQQIRSFCFVEDVIDAFEISIFRSRTDFCCVNIGNPEPVSIVHLVSIASKISQYAIAVERCQARFDDIRRRVPQVERAEQLIGWTPKVKLYDGLNHTINCHGTTSDYGEDLYRTINS